MYERLTAVDVCVCRLTVSWCTTGTGWPSSRPRARSSPTSWRRKSSRSRHSSRSSPSLTGQTVERLYCKRPILCLASSKILTPHRPASVYLPPLVRGRTHSLGGEGGGGVNILEDARYSSVLYICKYFVGQTFFSQSINQFCWSGIKLDNLLPHTRPLKLRRPNLRLSSTEAMASLPSPTLLAPRCAPHSPLLVWVSKRGKFGEDRGAWQVERCAMCILKTSFLSVRNTCYRGSEYQLNELFEWLFSGVLASHRGRDITVLGPLVKDGDDLGQAT